MFSEKSNKNTKKSFMAEIILISVLSVTLIAAVAYIQIFTTNGNNLNFKLLTNTIAYAQMNSKQGSSTTLIGDTNIPYSSSNDTKTTVVDNATKSNVSTSIDRAAIALNSTAANNFAKEPPTSPISPTGISTESLQQPPEHRILNNTAIPSGK
jgi:cytoskeletal protein RodZ